jgi:hypothetical protein
VASIAELGFGMRHAHIALAEGLAKGSDPR